MAVAFAARAALRVLPAVQLERETPICDLVLPIFRETTVSWAAVKYPAHKSELVAACRAAAANAFADPRPVSRAGAAANQAAGYAAVAMVRDTTSADAARAVTLSADAFADAATKTATAFHSAAAVAFWSAVSDDTRRVIAGVTAPDIVDSKLWPQHQVGPDTLMPLWNQLEAALLAENQDWIVWINWYRDRLNGNVKDEERELAYVQIDEALWSQGPAAVNAAIKKGLADRTGALAATEAPDIAALTGAVGWVGLPPLRVQQLARRSLH